MPKTSECKEEIYKSIGKKIYNLRLTNNVCVKEFSKTLGVSCHQLYKYEKGINKISLGRLFILAKIFQVELKYFYQDLENSNFINYNPVSNIKFEIADIFTKIPNLERKKAIYSLLKSLAEVSN